MMTKPRRRSPPIATQFRKGTSGNPKGRPKGAVSIERLTRQFALKTECVKIGGKTERMTRLEIAILKLKAVAATGNTAAAVQIEWLRGLTAPEALEIEGPVLLSPEALTEEEWIKRQEEANKHKKEPGTEIDVETNEFLKAARGGPSPLGEALLAFHEKYSI
ncbi:DUF5681 domain-containing protein [Bradyrhizobium tropiciagri]|uniref:DUF5681 domain-containing protein n=1 Tax=Bradyrhizobium tropiciagri TaxID=312253 RepID=UPI000A8DDB3F|nr:DUF5681 domain-containing protein [Bradyrhizobium tropiciagri]